MSDLGLRASNGGARGAGPVRVGGDGSPGGTGSRPMPPTEVMRRRRERDALRAQQAQASASSSAQQQLPPPQGLGVQTSPGRPGAGVAAQQSSSTSPSQPSQTYQPSSHQRQRSSARVPAQPSPQEVQFVPSPEIGLAEPSSGSSGQDPTAPRRPNIKSHDQPRPVPAGGAAPATTRFQGQQSAQPGLTPGPRQPTATAAASSSRTSAQPAAQPGTTNAFPHAFERWETLSSRWEGLTSYWIRKLEQSTQERARDPLVQQLSQHTTNLSQAGANLFHGLVELQRLRASSERKFSRWFHETRKDLEKKNAEIALLKQQLAQEKEAHSTVLTRMDNLTTEHGSVKTRYQKMLGDKEREMDISRGEARRAWEELGRREQEERERTAALRDGVPISVGGIQVVPTTHQISRGDTLRGGMAAARAEAAAIRPTTRDGSAVPPPLSGLTGAAMVDAQQPSPSNTDPFADSSGAAAFGVQQPVTTNGVHMASSSLPATFYQHPPTLLHQHQQQPQYGQAGPSSAGPPHIPISEAESEAPSFVPSDVASSDMEEEMFEYDERGRIRRDQYGNPIMHRRGHIASDDEQLDMEDEILRENQIRARHQQEHQQYTLGPSQFTSGVTYPSVPASTTGRIVPSIASTVAGTSAVAGPSSAAFHAQHHDLAAPPHPPPGIPTTATHAIPDPADEPTDFPEAEYEWDHEAVDDEGSEFAGLPAGVVSGRPLSDVAELDEDERSRVSEMSQHTAKASGPSVSVVSAAASAPVAGSSYAVEAAGGRGSHHSLPAGQIYHQGHHHRHPQHEHEHEQQHHSPPF